MLLPTVAYCSSLIRTVHYSTQVREAGAPALLRTLMQVASSLRPNESPKNAETLRSMAGTLLQRLGGRIVGGAQM